MELELDPAQPSEVVRAVGDLLRPADERTADPWWQAGVDELLELGPESA